MKTKTFLALSAIIVVIVAIHMSRQKKQQPEAFAASATIVNQPQDLYAAVFPQSQKNAHQPVSADRQVHAVSPLAQALTDYKKLSVKVLRSSADQRRYESLLSDSKLLGDAIASLNPLVPEEARMKSVVYLADAMLWAKNPKRAWLLQEVSEFVQSPIPESSQGMQLRKSVSADKIELFANLYAADPVRGRKLMQAPTSEMNARLMRFAYNFYLRTKK